MSLGIKKVLLAIAAIPMVLVVDPVARAQDESLTHEQNRVYRSAYFLGRGDTGIAAADEHEAIFYNPAGLARGKGVYKRTVLASPHIEFSQATRDLFRRLSTEESDPTETIRENIGRPNHAGVTNFTGLVLRRAALGAFASSGVNLMASKSPENGGLETIEAAAFQNIGVTFSLAESFFKESLMIGVTGKYIVRGRGYLEANVVEADAVKETVSDPSNFVGQGRGSGGDIGVLWRMGGRSDPTFGLTVENIGDSAITPEDDTSLDLDLKQTVNLGFSMAPGTKFSKLRLLVDYRDALSRLETNNLKKVHLGAELTVREMVGFTGGIGQGYPSFGFYMDLYFVRVDVGMYSEEIGERVGTRPDTRYFVRILSGF